MGGLVKAIFGGGGGGSKSSGGGGGGGAGAKKLFTPEQVQKVSKDYSSQGLAKWNQVLANMGAGEGTGTDLAGAISDQAKKMSQGLTGLTASSGYGSDGMSNLDSILKGLEGGIGAKYPVY